MQVLGPYPPADTAAGQLKQPQLGIRNSAGVPLLYISWLRGPEQVPQLRWALLCSFLMYGKLARVTFSSFLS